MLCKREDLSSFQPIKLGFHPVQSAQYKANVDRERVLTREGLRFQAIPMICFNIEQSSGRNPIHKALALIPLRFNILFYENIRNDYLKLTKFLDNTSLAGRWIDSRYPSMFPHLSPRHHFRAQWQMSTSTCSHCLHARCTGSVHKYMPYILSDHLTTLCPLPHPTPPPALCREGRRQGSGRPLPLLLVHLLHCPLLQGGGEEPALLPLLLHDLDQALLPGHGAAAANAASSRS